MRGTSSPNQFEVKYSSNPNFPTPSNEHNLDGRYEAHEISSRRSTQYYVQFDEEVVDIYLADRYFHSSRWMISIREMIHRVRDIPDIDHYGHEYMIVANLSRQDYSKRTHDNDPELLIHFGYVIYSHILNNFEMTVNYSLIVEWQWQKLLNSNQFEQHRHRKLFLLPIVTNSSVILIRLSKAVDPSAEK